MKTSCKVHANKRSALLRFAYLKPGPALALLAVCFLMHRPPKAVAQAPNSIAGTSFSALVTSNTDSNSWAPPGTRFLQLQDSSGNGYRVDFTRPYSSNFNNGTYSWSASGAIGTANLSDVRMGSLVETFTFAAASSGWARMVASNGSSMDSDFELFSGSAPDSLAGNVYSLQIEDGGSPLSSTGSLLLEITGADSYEIIGDGLITPSSSGIYFYSRLNTSTGSLLLNDSVMLSGTLYLSFSNSSGGGFALAQPSSGGFLVGHFLKLPSFAYTGSLNIPRGFHSATLLPNGKVIVVGGYNGSGCLASSELFDPSTRTWMMTGALTVTNRLRHTATLLPSGVVLVVGGWSGWNTLASSELYDPTTGVWTQTGSLGTGRCDHTATLLPNGRVLVTGGRVGAVGNSVTSSAELYDPAAGRWTTTGSMSANRWLHSATLLPSGKVLVAGGADASVVEQSSAELYDPESGTWIPTGGMTTNRADHSATLLANGLVLVAGGSPTPNPVPPAIFEPLPAAELYDPAAGTWRATGAMSDPRWDCHNKATLLPDGQVLVMGGTPGDGTSLASAELYGPATGTWTATDAMSIGRDVFTATLLSNGKVLVAGGQHWDDGSWLSSAELYDSTAGPIALVHLVKQPSGAFQFAFTDAANRTNTVLTTTDLSLPLADWTVLGVVPEIAPGLYLFSDPRATNGPQRFYRVRSP